MTDRNDAAEGGDKVSGGGPDAAAADTGDEGARPNRRRALAGAAVVVLALVGAGFAIFRQRHSVGPALAHMGPFHIAVGFACGLVGVGATYPVWWNILDGLGVTLPVRAGARIFFTSQLGKYLPGSVWPVVMQMEAGRSRGASRRTMLTANLLTILLSCASGLIVASAILPSYDPHVLRRYWWGLAAVPLLLALLHPRALTGVLDRVARVLRRPAEGGRLEWSAEAEAFAWSILSWLGLGALCGVLAATVTGWTLSIFALSVGATALAIPLGVLFVPAPAGAGIRDVVLGLVLASAMPAGRALAVVLACRVIIAACDVMAALLVTAFLRRGDGGAGERTRTSTPFGTRT